MPESNLFGSRNASAAAGAVAIVGVLVAGALTVPVAAAVGLPAVMLGPWQGLVGRCGGSRPRLAGVPPEPQRSPEDSWTAEPRRLLEVLDKPPCEDKRFEVVRS